MHDKGLINMKEMKAPLTASFKVAPASSPVGAGLSRVNNGDERHENIMLPCGGLLLACQTDDFILDKHRDWCKEVSVN